MVGIWAILETLLSTNGYFVGKRGKKWKSIGIGVEAENPPRVD